MNLLETFLFAPAERSSPPTRFWFSLSLTFAALYGLLALRQAFAGDYVIQDDARQHVFWMQRFVEPGAFPQDLIADYFQSLAPAGYTALYRAMAAIGIGPVLLSKLLPPVLGIVTTGYCFGIVLELLPVPLAGFITSLLLNQSIWLKDDLASATPKAFLYPLFFAFLYYLLRRDAPRSPWKALLPYLTALALLALFYPTYVLIAAGMVGLLLLEWGQGGLAWAGDRRSYWFCCAGLGVCFLGVLQYLVASSEFGPATPLAEARQLVEFLPGGQYAFFHPSPLNYWLFGKGSGFLPRSLFTPVSLLAGLFLPLLLRLPNQFPLARQVSPKIDLLPKLLVVCIGVFLAAHILLFKLYFPSRYTGHSLRIVMSLAAGIALTLMLEGLYRQIVQPTKGEQSTKGAQAEQRGRSEQRERSPKPSIATVLTIVAMGSIAIGVVCYPSFVSRFPAAGYIQGSQPALYQFFAKQPVDSLIASLSEEASNLPMFAQRPVLIAREYAIPFHLGYYRRIRQRLSDLIQAQYSPDLAVLRAFGKRYGIRFWLVDKAAFAPEYLTASSWRRQYQPEVTEAVASLQQGNIPALQRELSSCKVFETEQAVVVQATCLEGRGKP